MSNEVLERLSVCNKVQMIADGLYCHPVISCSIKNL